MATRLALTTMIVAAVLVCVLASAGVLLARDLYVDPINGDDANDGQSWQTALKTITRASELENGPGRISLGEGVFSVESGEVFPITLTQTTEIRGIAPDKTFIAVGYPPETIIWEDWEMPAATMSQLTFYSTLPGDADYDSDAFLLSVNGAMLYDDLLLRHVWFVGFVCWLSELSLIRTNCWDTRIEQCGFIDCKANLLGPDPPGPNSYLNHVSITGCLIQPTPGLSHRYGYGDLYIAEALGLTISDCIFRAASDQAVFFSYGGGRLPRVINCVWENIRFEYHTGWFDGEDPVLGGCTFRDSVFSFNGWYHRGYPGTDIVASIFDAQSYIEIEEGVVSAEYSYIENPPILHYCGSFSDYGNNIVDGDPAFAAGPLGASYLANEESGQSRTSRCLDVIDLDWDPPWWRGFLSGWPPEGSTTRTDGVPDEWPYDIGYHYPSVPPPPPAVLVRTDRTEYAAGEEMQVFMSFENRGVKVEGAIYFAFGPESLDWLIYWPWMTFVPTPWAEGTLYSGVSYPNLPPTAHTIPDSLAAGGYLWLGAVLASDGAFASDIALWPVTISAD